jgi:predicted HTH transcriptional regulator
MGRHVFEDEQFDFKESLPDSRDDKAKDRLRKTCCAFANTEGGFLVFGVANATSLSAHKRLVGFDTSLDFPEHFGNFPLSCIPSVPWIFLNPPLKLENGRLIHVVHILKSWRAPHSVGNLEVGWIFPKRTNKGNEAMNMDEIRSAFLGLYEKRLKLQLLKSELSTIKQNALGCFVVEPEKVSSHYSLVSFDTAIVDSIVADTYSITAAYSGLLSMLSLIRERTRVANNKIQLFYHVAMIGMTNKDQIIREHNEFLKSIGEEISKLCDYADAELDKVLKP